MTWARQLHDGVRYWAMINPRGGQPHAEGHCDTAPTRRQKRGQICELLHGDKNARAAKHEYSEKGKSVGLAVDVIHGELTDTHSQVCC